MTTTYTQISTELRNLESMADHLWELRYSEGLTAEYLGNFDYSYSEGLRTNFSRLLGGGGISKHDSKDSLLGEIVTMARTPVLTGVEDYLSFAEEGGSMNPEVVVSLLKKIIASVYTGKESNITKMVGMDGKPLGEENKFGYNPEDGTISGMFLGSGDDPLEFVIDGDKISYSTAKNFPAR